jgi:hypothetical protein
VNQHRGDHFDDMSNFFWDESVFELGVIGMAPMTTF